MQQPRRLGKGLGSLLEESSDALNAATGDNGVRVMDLDIAKVFPNPDQPRKEFDDESLEELASSISEKGVIQPILVLANPDATYMIIAGERRYRASLKAGRTSIPAIVKTYSVEETMEVALIENLQRENLNPMEEALAFANLIERFNLSQEEIARKIGKNRTTVANSLRLLKLPASIQQGITANSISAGHARALLSIKNEPAAQEALYQSIIVHGLSVRDAEWIAQSVNAGGDVAAITQQRLDKNNGGGGTGPESANAGDPQAAGGAAGTAGSIDVMALSKGATIKQAVAGNAAAGERRAPELWDLEEKLIVALGTKVQLKGDLSNGRIEITYFSRDDLERLFELLGGKAQG